MSIKSTHCASFTNAEHFQFMKDVDGQIMAVTPEAIDLGAEYPEFKDALADEERSFSIVPKSALTLSIEEADAERDRIYVGFAAQLRGLLRHFDPATAQAAYRLSVQWGSYGNLNEATYDQQTAGTHNLILALRSEKFMPDVTLLSLQAWVDALDTANQTFESTLQQRYAEQGQKDALTRLRTARLRTDRAYMAMRSRVNAGITFNGEERYRTFVLNLNAHIDRYNATVARRRES
jgi:hypothetical protein